ncbi:PREDICTED: cinnamoyl-CoA reductase 1-like isoform X1 [Brassica oleracea var. oleracea]|uniref:NAD-dependent epimerase/dehydratase domain-containing protein n=1 Tax=Brassica oleracea var. oleracea TaxID=109376 RepID=A0A0D3C8R8_BRAOL|nr:PREDICTED: cinnamoyl-CoA reductase 1-like isoform X1 [Brassica oleracea var. oleracea]
MNGGGQVVCVTGSSGYIASWIVKLLLLRGYTVRATVQNPTDTAETEHLLALEGAKERLKLFKADLLEDCSFEQAIEGCDAVFHTASPVKFIVTDPQTELIDPAVKGTFNVLNTCKKTSSVKRVIVTSSTAAVLVRQPPLEPNDVVDETFFSDSNVCMERKLWYPLSKTLAENVAWQFAKDNRMDMVVINPGFIIGPLLQPTLNFSVEIIVDIVKGKNPFNCRYYSFVDVRDVALAHVKALESPSANGRYIISGQSVTINHIKETMHELFPNLCIDDPNVEGEMEGINCKMCVDKVKNLGVEFTPLKSSLGDTIISLKEKYLL